MAKVFDFSSLNQERLFDISTKGFDYFSLQELFEEFGEGHIFIIRGAYIGTRSEYYKETPNLALDDRYVNLPQFQLDCVKAMRENSKAVDAINAGVAGFYIEPYNKDGNIFYKAVFCNVESEEADI